MRFCRLSVTSRSSRRRESCIVRRARIRMSESSPSKRSLAEGLAVVVATGTPFSVYRRGDYAPAFAETDAAEIRGFAPAAQHDFVAVFEKSAGVAARELEGLGASRRQFQQAAAILALRAGNGAAPDQIARPEIAPVGRVVRDHLRERPVHPPK